MSEHIQITDAARVAYRYIVEQNDLDLAAHSLEREKHGREVFLLPLDLHIAITTATADMEREKNCALEQLRIVQQTNANLWSQISAEQRHRMNVDGLVDVLTPLETKIADMERQIGELNQQAASCHQDWLKAVHERDQLQQQIGELKKWKDGIIANAPKCGACAENLFCGGTMHQHDSDCAYTERDTLRQQLEDLKKREEAAAQACFESHCEIMNERDNYKQQLEVEQSRELCTACNQTWNPSLIESGTCIFCIQKETKQQLEEARRDTERLNLLERFFSKPYNNQHINYPALPVRLNRHMPDWSIAKGFGTLESSIGQGNTLREAIDSAIATETKDSL